MPVAMLGQTAVTTGHYDQARTGANQQEAILNPTNVRPDSFGYLGSLAVSGCVIAQPLYVPNVQVEGVGPRNLIYVATTNNLIYGFDADTFEVYLSRYLGAPVDSSHINPQIGYYDFPNCDGVDELGPVGVVGTPVIDPAASAMYVVSNQTEFADDVELHKHILYKLDLRNLGDVTPAVHIEGTFQDKQFDSYFQLQRPALLLNDGLLYIAFASHTDATPYAGWMFTYDTNLTQVRVVSYSPVRSGAGIWQSGAGPAFSDGKIYLTTGNNAEGEIEADDNADSILQVDPQTLEVTGRTSFPAETNDWDYADIDLGSSRVVPLPGTHYALAGSKFGDMFVMDRNGMQLVTRFQAAGRLSKDFDWTGIYNGLAVWNDLFFVWPGGGGWNQGTETDFPSDVLRGYRVNADGSVTLIALGQTDGVSAGYQGAGLAVSSNGADADSAIIWAAIPEANTPWLRNGHLSAYAANATGAFQKLWSDTDQPGSPEHHWAKFSQPTVVNGRVYLPTFSGRVQVYGLLPKNPTPGASSDRGTRRRALLPQNVQPFRGPGANVPVVR